MKETGKRESCNRAIKKDGIVLVNECPQQTRCSLTCRPRKRQQERERIGYMTVQHPLPEVGAKGSSFLSIGPHTDGTIGSRVVLQ